ncbi:hypothetical protein Tco_1515242, partial [Tanacetum coccineum]
MFHQQSSQVIHPQSSHMIHPQSSQVTHLQLSQAPAISLQSSADHIQSDSGFVVPYFLPTDDPLESFYKALSFIYAGDKVDSGPDCDEVPTVQATLMANLSNYGSDVLSEVPYTEKYQNDMDNQSVQAMQYFEQTPIIDLLENEIISDSNIIPYSQYLLEKQQETVQDTNSSVQQDVVIHYVIEQMSIQMMNHVDNWNKANKESKSESLDAELERYKERVQTFEQRLNIDLSTREKFIESQMDGLIKEKLALKEQIDSLKQNLSTQIKEKDSLVETFNVFKNESKQKENNYLDTEIDLQNE